MKIALPVLLAACLFAQPADDLPRWLAGSWTGTLGRARLLEQWTAPAGSRMLGVGTTVAGERMVEFEFLRIEKRADGIFYVAQPGGRPPVDFRLTKAGPGEVVFENPVHDNPKIITYRKDGDKGLVAIIEGDESGRHKRVEFRFTKAADAVAP